MKILIVLAILYFVWMNRRRTVPNDDWAYFMGGDGMPEKRKVK